MCALRSPLSSIAVVLVHPESPANVGAVARIVRNFGFGPLKIVGEPLHEHPDAERLAHRSLGVLRRTEVHPGLASAIAGVDWVLGTSGRIRKKCPTPVPIRSAVPRVVWRAERGRVALVFGPESDGLSLVDLARCHEVVRIPQCVDAPALNLAQAVAIVGSELFHAAVSPGSLAPPETAGSDDRDRLVRRMARIARHCGLSLRNRPEEMVEALRQVFRSQTYTPYDVAVLERWLAQIEWFVGLRNVVTGGDRADE